MSGVTDKNDANGNATLTLMDEEFEVLAARTNGKLEILPETEDGKGAGVVERPTAVVRPIQSMASAIAIMDQPQVVPTFRRFTTFNQFMNNALTANANEGSIPSGSVALPTTPVVLLEPMNLNHGINDRQVPVNSGPRTRSQSRAAQRERERRVEDERRRARDQRTLRDSPEERRQGQGRAGRRRGSSHDVATGMSLDMDENGGNEFSQLVGRWATRPYIFRYTNYQEGLIRAGNVIYQPVMITRPQFTILGDEQETATAAGAGLNNNSNNIVIPVPDHEMPSLREEVRLLQEQQESILGNGEISQRSLELWLGRRTLNELDEQLDSSTNSSD